MTDPAKKADAPADTSLMSGFFSEVSRALDALGATLESTKGTTSTSEMGKADTYKPSKYADKYKPSKNADKNVIDIAGSGVLELFRPFTKAKPESKYDLSSPDWAEITWITEAVAITHDMIEVVVAGGVTTFFPDSLDDFDHDHIEDVSEHAELITHSADTHAFGDMVHKSAAGLDAKSHVEGAPAIPSLAKIHEVSKAGAEAKDHVKDHEKIK